MHLSKPPLGVPLEWSNPLNRELVLHLAMNEGHGDRVYDLSGYGNHGTLKNFAFPPTVASGWNPGRMEVGLRFDGSNDYISVDQNNGLPIYSDTSPYSIEIWVKGSAGQSDKRVFAEGNTASNTPMFGIGTDYNGINAKCDLFIRDDVGSVRMAHVQSTNDIFDSDWHHIVWVDNNGNAKLYIDGILDATDFSYTPTTITLNTTSIGALERTSVSSCFNGNIDEVRIYRRALSAAEILERYINPFGVYLDEDD